MIKLLRRNSYLEQTKGAFSDTLFSENPRGFISDIKTFRRIPHWRVSRIQTNCSEGGIRTKESESRDLSRQAREILPKLRARLADEQSRRTIKFSSKAARIARIFQSNLRRRKHRAYKEEWNCKYFTIKVSP